MTYLEERLDERNLHISTEKYNFRKERFTSRIGEILAYAKTKSRCRSQYLLSYFGELNAGRCGQCDVCAGDDVIEPGREEFNVMMKEIEKLLRAKAFLINELIEIIGYPPDNVITGIEWLIDQGRLQRDETLRLVWKE